MNPQKNISSDVLQAAVTLQRQFIAGEGVPRVSEDALRLLLRLTESTYALIGEFNPASAAFEVRAIVEVVEGDAREVSAHVIPPELESMLAKVIDEQQPVFAGSPLASARVRSSGNPSLESVLGIPLVREGELVGVVCLANRRGGYDGGFVDRLAPLTEACAVMLWAARNQRQQQLDLDELRARTALLECQNELSLDGMLIVDHERRWLLCNNRFLAMWQIPAGLADRRSTQEFVRQLSQLVEDGERFVEQTEEIYAHPDRTSLEEIRLKDGRILERYGVPYRLNAGPQFGRAWYFRDITERKRAEQDLRNLAESASPATGENFFHSMVENLARSLGVSHAYIGRLESDAPARVRTIAGYGDGRALDTFSYDLAGTPCQDVVSLRPCCHPSGVQQKYPDDRFLVDLGIEGYIGIPLIDGAGRVLGLVSALSRSAIRRPESALHQMMVWAARATAELERLAAVEELRESRSVLEKAQAVGQVGSWISDPGRVGHVAWSAETCRIFGLNPESFDGRVESFFSMIHPADLPAVQEASRQALAGAGEYLIEHRIVRADGKLRWVHQQADVERDAAGNPARMVGVVRDITEAKLTQDTLQESEARFRQLFENSPDAIFVEDLEGNVLDVNPAACRLHDLERHELAGRHFSQLVPPEQREEALRGFARIVSGEASHIDGYSWTRSGHCLPVAIRASRIEYFGKEAILLHVRDVTAQRAAEDALRASEERLRLVLEQLPAVVWTVNRQEQITLALGKAMVQLGRTPENTVGLSLAEYFQGRFDAEQLRQHHVRALGGESIQYSTEACGLAFECRVQPLRSAQGETVGCLGVALDVSGRMRAERELHRRNQELEAIFQAYPDLYFVVSAAGQIEQYRAGLTSDLYVPPEVFLGKDLHAFLPPNVAARFDVAFQRLAGGSRLETVEYELDMAGRLRQFEARVASLPDQRVAVLVRNITDRKHLEERLASQQAELLHASRLSTMGHMLATMSHEISQPLAALGNYTAACTSLLKESPAPQPEQFRHFVGEIARQSERAAEIIKRLRRFGAKAFPDRAPCDLHWLLRDSAELVASELRRQGVTLHWELAEPAPRVLIDRVQLQQVVVNLLTNACDALQEVEPPRRQASIRSCHDRDWAVIEIVDSGPGLSAEVLHSIFQPFFTTKPEGMGLGLSICREIVEDHGGHIEAVNGSHGGAIFRLRMPLEESGARDQGSGIRNPKDLADATRGGGDRIPELRSRE